MKSTGTDLVHRGPVPDLSKAFADVLGGSSSADPMAPFHDLVLRAPPAIADSIKSDLQYLSEFTDEDGSKYTSDQIAEAIREQYKPTPSMMKSILSAIDKNNRRVSRAFVGAAGDMAGFMAGAPVDLVRAMIAGTSPQLQMSDIPGAQFGLAGATERTDALQDMIAPPPEPGLASMSEKATEGIFSSLPTMGAGGFLPAIMSGGASGAALDVAQRAKLSPFATFLLTMTAGLGAGMLPGTGGLGPLMRRKIMGGDVDPATLRAYEHIDVPGTVSNQARPGSLANKGEHVLRHIAGGTKPIFTQSQRMSMGFSDAIDKLADKLGGAATVTEAGEVAQKAGTQWIKKWQRQSGKAWEKFAQQTPLDTPTDAENVLLKTRALVLENAGRPEKFRNTVTEEYYQQLVDWLHLGGDTRPTVGDLLKIRAQIGKDLSRIKPPNTPTPERAELRAMYKAVSQDIEASLTTPAQRAAFRAANKITREGHATLKRIIEPVLAKNTPEEAFRYMMGGSRDGATRLKTLYSGMTKEQQRLVTQANLERLGHSPTGARMEPQQFLPERWLANLEHIDPEARAVLFDGMPADAKKDLDALIVVARNQRANQSKLGQPTTALATSFNSIITRTLAGMTAGAAKGASMGGAPGAVVGGIVGGLLSTTPQGAARVVGNYLANPRAMVWLMKQSTLPASMAASQINALKNMGIRYGDQELIGLANMLMENGQPGEAEAASVLQSSGGDSVSTVP